MANSRRLGIEHLRVEREMVQLSLVGDSTVTNRVYLNNLYSVRSRTAYSTQLGAPNILVLCDSFMD